MIPAGLISRLADGEFHSGEALAAGLGVTRAAVWKQVRQLARLGLAVERVRGRGYRLAGGLQLLDAARLRARLPPEVAARVAGLEVVASVPSTNSALMADPDPGVRVLVAEHQTAGRGRRGRDWVSPFGANLYLSVAWPFDELPRGIQALSLAVGVGIADRLTGLGLPDITLKWPNDLWHARRKLGGILVEMRGETHGRTRAVIGVGLNLRMPEAAGAGIEQAWTDIWTMTGGRPPGREALVSEVIAAVVLSLAEFSAAGFAPFAARWTRRDALRGAAVEFEVAGERRAGRAAGIDADGGLVVVGDDGTSSVRAGEVQVRWA